jgi:23S rRNA pseudouridine1911/1915/1917 synthase
VPKREFVVSAGSGPGQRLDVYLAEHLEGLTRSRIRKLIDEGKVMVNAASKKAGHKLRENDLVEAEVGEEPSPELRPQEVPLTVLYSDDRIVVIDKPCGLVVHPGAGNREGTLAAALLYRFPEISGLGPAERPGIVHRLDKETSGVMVVARSPEAYASLQKQFKDRDVRKVYLGLAWGKMPPEGHIDRPIGRHTKHGQRMSVRTRKPRPAETFYKVREEFKGMSFLEIRPVTGRTHQIRVHLAATGHPLAGDSRYGRRKEEPKFPRLFLHAHRLSFIHPGTGERVEFTSELPSGLANILEKLRMVSSR